MAQNIRLGGQDLKNRTLTSDNSDVSIDFTVPQSSSSFGNSNDVAYLYIDNGTYLDHGVIGGYYSWKAATAGTGTGAMASGNASSSICPKGWHLPDKNEYQTMADAYNNSDDELKATPVPNFGLFGQYNNGGSGGLSYKGTYNLTWTSTAYSASTPYNFTVGQSRNVISINDKREGYSVRCMVNF